MFLSHFERGLGLPLCDFMQQFMVRFGLQPHHLPANAILSLAIFISSCEGYLGLWPTVALWTKFFTFKRQVIPDKGNPNKELTQCGAATISPRRGSVLPRVTGLESCKMWQRTFFYVRNTTEENLIGLPAFVIGPPACLNWGQPPPKRDKEITQAAARVEELKGQGLNGACPFDSTNLSLFSSLGLFTSIFISPKNNAVTISADDNDLDRKSVV